MKFVTLKIPENKLEFFIELVYHLGLEISEEEQIPEEHKAIVRERMGAVKAEQMIPWEEARQLLTFKGKV